MFVTICLPLCVAKYIFCRRVGQGYLRSVCASALSPAMHRLIVRPAKVREGPRRTSQRFSPNGDYIFRPGLYRIPLTVFLGKKRLSPPPFPPYLSRSPLSSLLSWGSHLKPLTPTLLRRWPRWPAWGTAGTSGSPMNSARRGGRRSSSGRACRPSRTPTFTATAASATPAGLLSLRHRRRRQPLVWMMKPPRT